MITVPQTLKPGDVIRGPVAFKGFISVDVQVNGENTKERV